MIKLGEDVNINPENILIISISPGNEFAALVARYLGIKNYSRLNKEVFYPDLFTGGEFNPIFLNPEKVAGKTVYIISTTDPWSLTPQERVRRMEMVAKNAKQHEAGKVIAVPVDLPYSRQDRVFFGLLRSLRNLAENYKTNGVDQVLTVHVHSNRAYSLFGEVYFESEIEQILDDKLLEKYPEVTAVIEEHIKNRSLVDFLDLARPGKVKIDDDGKKIFEKREYFDMENEELVKKVLEFYDAFDKITLSFGKKIIYSLNPAPILAHYLSNNSTIADKIESDGSNLVFVYADAGARLFGESIRKYFPSASYIQIKKVREEPNDPEKVFAEIDHTSDEYNGTKDKYIILPDDGTETAGTLVKAVKASRTLDGEPAGIILYFTHPWLNGTKYEEPQLSLVGTGAQEILTTNTNSNIENHRRWEFKQRNAILRIADCVGAAIKYGFELNQNPEEVLNVGIDELDKVGNLYMTKKNPLWFGK